MKKSVTTVDTARPDGESRKTSQHPTSSLVARPRLHCILKVQLVTSSRSTTEEEEEEEEAILRHAKDPGQKFRKCDIGE